MMTGLLQRAIAQTKAENAERESTGDDSLCRLRSCTDVALLRGMIEDLLEIPQAAHTEGYGAGAFEEGMRQSWEGSDSRKRLEQIRGRLA